MDHADALDLMSLVRHQPLFHRCRIHTMAPITGHELRLQLQASREIEPEGRELASFIHQNPVTRRQCIHQRGFPRARARCGINDYMVVRLKDLLDICQKTPRHLAECRATMIHRRIVNRTQHAVWNIGRPRNLQKVSPACISHWSPPAIGIKCIRHYAYKIYLRNIPINRYFSPY